MRRVGLSGHSQVGHINRLQLKLKPVDACEKADIPDSS